MKTKGKKVLLITLQDNNNMGNRLQNYAFQTVLENHNLDVINLDNGYSDIPVNLKIRFFIKFILSIVGLRKDRKDILNRRKRYCVNRNFTNTYIHNIEKVTYRNAFQKSWDDYALGFVGSDQVWHKWRNDGNELPYYYLEFLPNEKRVAYAASFGFEQFPVKDRCQHIQGIRGMSYISCREKSGCDLVENILHPQFPKLTLSLFKKKVLNRDI